MRAELLEAPAFAFKDCALISIATGKRAYDLRDLRELVATAPRDSIYFHFWGGMLEARFEKREYNNDFADWLHDALHDPVLAERLAMVDPAAWPQVEGLRQTVLDLIDDRLYERSALLWTPAQEPFVLMRSQIIVFDTHQSARTLQELCELLPQQSPESIFYHFIDARRRLADGEDDFRFWLSAFGRRYAALCLRLEALDPYFTTLSELRERLIRVFREALEADS